MDAMDHVDHDVFSALEAGLLAQEAVDASFEGKNDNGCHTQSVKTR